MGFSTPEVRLRDRVMGVFSPYLSLAAREIRAVHQGERAAMQDEFVSPNVHQQQLAAELAEELAFDSGQGQIFGGLHANRDAHAPDGSVQLLVIENGYLGDARTIASKARVYQHAMALPDWQIVLLDQPGHGLSDPYTAAQRHEMFGHGELATVGYARWQSIERAAGRILPVSSLVMKGDSYGGYQGLQTIAASKDETSSLECDGLGLFDTPLHSSRFGAHLDFGYEVLRAGRYKESWAEQYLGSMAGFLSDYGFRPDAALKSFIKQDKLAAARNFYRSVLGHGKGIEYLRAVHDAGVPIVRVRTEVGRIDKVADAEADQAALQVKTGTSFAHVVLRFDSHEALGQTTCMRLVARLGAHVFRTLARAEQADLHTDGYVLTSMREIQRGRLPQLTESAL